MVTRLRTLGWKVLLAGCKDAGGGHYSSLTARSLSTSVMRYASSHAPKMDTSSGDQKEPSSQGHAGGSGHGHGDAHGHGHGHDDHHHDPYDTWYEEPANNLVYRNTRLKVPFYIGSPPEMTYRAPPTPSVFMEWNGYILAMIMWWWILWGILDEPGHVTGEFFFPDRTKFTDEELGIPPLD